MFTLNYKEEQRSVYYEHVREVTRKKCIIEMKPHKKKKGCPQVLEKQDK